MLQISNGLVPNGYTRILSYKRKSALKSRKHNRRVVDTGDVESKP